MALRRRRFKGTWFPGFGTEGDGGEPRTAGLYDHITHDNTAKSTTQVFAIINDSPRVDPDDETQSLADTIGSEYALRRIVGKFHANFGVTSGTPEELVVKLGLGFFIARENESLDGVPIGVEEETWAYSGGSGWESNAFDSYSPLALETTRQPWIWRRTWTLFANAGTAGWLLPQSTMNYGSVLDGPHIDAKTRRRVRQEERLYVAIGLQYQALGHSETPGDVTVFYDLDLRYFGALRKARNKSAF